MNWLLAGASGGLLVLLFPHFGITLLAPFALTPLVLAIARERSARNRVLLGELCGFIFWMGVCYWIRPVLAEYGGLNIALSWLAMTLFALAKGIHLAVFSYLAGFMVRSRWAIAGTAALWTGLERTHGTFGFAWLTLGNAGSDMSLPLRLAPWLGVYGLSFAFAALSVGLALLILRRPRRQLMPLLFLPALFLLPEMPDVEPPVSEAVVLQPDLVEGASARLAELVNRTEVEAVNGAALIAWPEVPSGFYWDRDPVFRRTIQALARSASAPVLFAGVTQSPEERPLNSAILLNPNGEEAGRYSKTFLVPFGEFVPPLFGWIDKISTESSDFVAGDGPHVLASRDLKLGTFICYEAAFPHLVRRFPALGASVLVNLSNDGWFFRTAAREQHLLLARMRAAENRRWLLRVTNNGITASIDPAGRVRETLPEFRETAGRLPFSPVANETFYTRHGDIFAWTCLAFGLALSAWYFSHAG